MILLIVLIWYSNHLQIEKQIISHCSMAHKLHYHLLCLLSKFDLRYLSVYNLILITKINSYSSLQVRWVRMNTLRVLLLQDILWWDPPLQSSKACPQYRWLLCTRSDPCNHPGEACRGHQCVHTWSHSPLFWRNKIDVVMSLKSNHVNSYQARTWMSDIPWIKRIKNNEKIHHSILESVKIWYSNVRQLSIYLLVLLNRCFH